MADRYGRLWCVLVACCVVVLLLAAGDAMAADPEPPEDSGFFDSFYNLLGLVIDAIYKMFVDGIAFILLGLTKLIFDIATEVGVQATEQLFIYLDEINLSDHVMDAWTSIPTAYRNVLGFFHVPEIINTVISYGVTNFVMRWVPFIGSR